ncbi:hypothetical protein HOY80DRAFT_896105, partial [Tuber brumale]
IVSHNQYLSKRYDAHINVEVCSSIKGVKYIYKSGDKVNISIGQQNSAKELIDEVKNYLDTQYIFPPEECYKPFSYKMHDKDPAVY